MCFLRGRLAVLLVITASAAPARAQSTGTGTTTMTGTFTKDDFKIWVAEPDAKNVPIPINTQRALSIFNHANCECKKRIQIVIEYQGSGFAKAAQLGLSDAFVMVGPASCIASDQQTRSNANCREFPERVDLPNLGRGRRVIETSVAALFNWQKNPTGDALSSCGTEIKQVIWLWVDAPKDTIPDLTAESAPQLVIDLDGNPPRPPTNLEVTGGNEALEVSWKTPTGIIDIAGSLVFCSRGGDLAVFDPSFYNGQYSVCPNESASAVEKGDAGASSDAGAALTAFIPAGDSVEDASKGQIIVAPDQFRNLDPAYLCSGLLTTQSSTRLYTLQNGIPYLVGVATVDKHYNASPIEEVALQYPIPTRDFYRGYVADGGKAVGGYCTVAGGRSRRFGLVELGVSVFIAGLSLWRRRKERR